MDDLGKRVSKKKVLVTGASGFLGHAVVQELSKREQYEVTAVISGRHHIDFPSNVCVAKANLLSSEDREHLIQSTRPNYLLHLAWGLGDGSFLTSAENVRWLEASTNLMMLFERAGGERLAFAGTSSEYGTSFTGNVESNQEIDYSLYGICKLSFEKVASCFCRDRNIGFTSARYFSMYGPGDDRPGRALPVAIQTMLTGDAFSCKRPWNIWDYIYIDDAAEATARLLESDYSGPINIASGRPVTMKEVFSTVADVIGRPDLLQCNEKSRASSVLTADTHIMNMVLGDCCRTPLRQGIERTVQWWRDKHETELGRFH